MPDERLALFLVSLDEPVKDDSLLTDYVLAEILYASMSDDDKDSETRTYVGGEDGKAVLWKERMSYIQCSLRFRHMRPTLLAKEPMSWLPRAEQQVRIICISATLADIVI